MFLPIELNMAKAPCSTLPFFPDTPCAQKYQKWMSGFRKARQYRMRNEVHRQLSQVVQKEFAARYQGTKYHC